MTGGRRPNLNRRARFATLHDQSLQPQIQPPFKLFSAAMAVQAIGLQDRANVLFKRDGWSDRISRKAT